MSQKKNPYIIPKNVKVIMATAAVFMPIFLILPFFFWNPTKPTAQSPSYSLLQSERLAPVGRLNVGGEAVAVAEAAPFSAEGTYQSVCAACHGTGLLDSPKAGDQAAWQARLDARGGLDALIASGIKGLNAMPAKGGANVSDDEFGQVVRYILDMK